MIVIGQSLNRTTYARISNGPDASLSRIAPTFHLSLFFGCSLLAFNIAMLVLGPLILLFLYNLPAIPPETMRESLYVRLKTLISETWKTQLTSAKWLEGSWWKRHCISVKSLRWMKPSWRRGKFWVALISGLVLQMILVAIFMAGNKCIIYSHPYVFFISSLILAYLSTGFILNLHTPPCYSDLQRPTLVLQMYILSWPVLLALTIAWAKWTENATKVSVILSSGWSFFILLGNISGALELSLSRQYVCVNESQHPPTNVPIVTDGGLGDQEPASPDTIPDEQTPLILSSHPSQPDSKHMQAEARGWWRGLQLFLILPVPISFAYLSIIVYLAVTYGGACPSEKNSLLYGYAGMGLFLFLSVFSFAPLGFISGPERWFSPAKIVIRWLRPAIHETPMDN